LGSEPLILRNYSFKERENSILFGKRGKAKRMQQLLDSTCFFTWTFQERGSIAPGHVGTLFFLANEKLRGIEHAQLEKEP
jgi:hypothetical protein